MRIGIMGLSEGHVLEMLASAKKAANAQLVGVVEPIDRFYERACQDMAIPRYASLDEMIAEARPELILEGVNHAQKVELVEKAAAAGIHLLLDKPLCRNLDDFQRIKAAITQSNIQVSMWFTSRSFRPFVALRKQILAGELGELVSFISTHPHRLRANHPKWYTDQNVYSGTFVDLACHGVDQIRWLSGAEYVGVHALASTIKRHQDSTYEGFNDSVQASFRLSSGAIATVTADWLIPPTSPYWGDTRFIIMGTKGCAHLRAYADNHVLVLSDEHGVQEIPIEEHEVTFVQDMIDSLENGSDLFVSTEDVLAVAQASLMAEESIKRGGEYLKIE
ncbi:MAG: Gfo/Idh/MocA family protein [Limnochordia bacterium]|jgi:predicted dehydrogenase